MIQRMRFVLVPLCALLLLGVSSPQGRSQNPADEKKTHYVTIHVPSPERAQLLRTLGIKCKEAGTISADVSDQLLAQLRAKGYKVAESRYGVPEEFMLDANIWDMYLGSRTEATAGRPKIAMYKKEMGPRVKERDWQMWFLKDNNVKISAVPYDDFAVSKHGEFAAILRPSADGKQTESYWDTYECSGRKAEEAQVVRYPDEPIDRVVVSDAGNWVQVAMTEPLRASFFSGGGNAPTEVSFADKKGVDLSFDLSSNGKFLLVQFLKHRGGEGRNELSLYDLHGQKVWGFAPEEQFYSSSSLSVSGDGSSVASFTEWGNKTEPGGSSSVVYLLGKGGVVIRKITGMVLVHAEFSTSGEYVALSDLQGNIMLLETRSGRTMGTSEAKGGRHIYDLQVAETARLLVAVDDASISILDFTGKKIGAIRCPADLPGPFRRISCSDSGNEISLASGNRFFVYKRSE